MNSLRSCLLSVVPVALLISAPANASAVFTFEDIAAGSVAPVSSTVNGLTATFTGQVSVCSVAGLNFATLSGNALIQGVCTPGQLGPISVGFSSTLSSASFNFATGGRPSAPLTVQAFDNSTLVGTSVFTSSVPPGNFPNGEGPASFSGTFNSFVLTTTGPLGVDNINAVTGAPAVPEPASLSMFAAGGAILVTLARRTRKRQTN
jgi:hypothetical protein